MWIIFIPTQTFDISSFTTSDIWLPVYNFRYMNCEVKQHVCEKGDVCIMATCHKVALLSSLIHKKNWTSMHSLNVCPLCHNVLFTDRVNNNVTGSKDNTMCMSFALSHKYGTLIHNIWSHIKINVFSKRNLAL